MAEIDKLVMTTVQIDRSTSKYYVSLMDKSIVMVSLSSYNAAPVLTVIRTK